MSEEHRYVCVNQEVGGVSSGSGRGLMKYNRNICYISVSILRCDEANVEVSLPYGFYFCYSVHYGICSDTYVVH